MGTLVFTIHYIFLLFLVTGISGQTISIEGKVIDKKTGKPLPYASIVLKGVFMGTIAGPNGDFTVYIPDSLKHDTIQINYLGYNTFERPISKVANSLIEVRLKQVPTEIEAVIVKPFLPEDILRMAIRNIPVNYPQEPFIAEGFYLEEFIENDIYINFAEAFVEIYSPPFGDTSKCKAKIIQARTRDSLGNIRFLETLVQKKIKKEKRKADRKRDTINTADTSSKGIQIIFGGPQSALLTDFVRNKKMFLDTKKFKKFDFSYEKDNSLGGKNLYVVRCKNKNAINYLYMNALVYIDKESYAIVKVTSNNTGKIPGFVKPILSLYRMKVGTITLNIDNEYRFVNNKWYPSKVLLTFDSEATKKYRKGIVEHGIFSAGQAFATTNIKTADIQEFSEDEVMSDKSLEEQMGEYNPDFWENRTKIEYSIK